MSGAAGHDTPVFVFADLDDSLFNSARKCPPGVPLEPAALLKNGEVVSYTNPRQRALLHWLRQGATIVPVTARSAEGAGGFPGDGRGEFWRRHPGRPTTARRPLGSAHAGGVGRQP